MRKLVIAALTLLLIIIIAFKKETSPATYDSRLTTRDTLLYPEESHLSNIQQLTFGGDNAEAYWSYDGKHIVFQRTDPKEGLMCDQIFIGKVPQAANEKFEYRMVSTGKGRTTCPYFTKDGKNIIYASTHLAGDPCPTAPDKTSGSVPT